MNSSATGVFKVVRCVTGSTPVSVTELSQKLKIPAGTVFRNLNALERSGFVARFQASSRYVLGPSAKRLRSAVLEQFRCRNLVIPFLRQLASMTGETTALVMPIGFYGVRVATSRGSNEVIAPEAIGDIHPLHHNGTSRIILAGFDTAQLSAYSKWAAERYPDWRMDDILPELEAIRERLYITESLSYARDHSSISFPIRVGDRWIGALGIEGPVLDPSEEETGSKIALWRALILDIEALIDKDPDIATNPFEHLDPSAISFDFVDKAAAQDE